MRREEGGDGIELGLHRRGAGAAGGNAAGDAGLERDLGVKIVFEDVGIGLIGLERQLLKDGVVRDAVRHQLAGNFIRAAEGDALFRQIIGQIRGVDEALLRGQQHVFGFSLHGREHRGHDLQAELRRVDAVEHGLLILLHILVVGEGQALERGEQGDEIAVDPACLAAAELGSLTATAELLGYTQSGVTRMIGTLEEELGFPLFLRSKKGVQLTENGKLMLPLLREVVRAHHNAEQLSAEIGGVSKGSLTIGCYYSISALWMPEILTAFRARYPGVTVRMQEGGNLEMARWLNERSVDCCFGAQMHGDKYDWLPVFRDELVAWLPRGHELAEADAFPLTRLQDEPFIHTSPNHDTDQDRLLEQHDLHPQTCFTTRDGFTTYNMVEAGLGVSFNQRLISRKWSGTVAEVPFDPPQFVTLGISVPSLKEASPAAKKFIACAIETVTGGEKSLG